MSTAHRLAEKLLQLQAVAKEAKGLSEAFVREEYGEDGIPDGGILRDLWYFHGSDHMNFLSGERLEYGSPTEMAVRVLQYANQKAAASSS